jgi:hypothetical protein
VPHRGGEIRGWTRWAEQGHRGCRPRWTRDGGENRHIVTVCRLPVRQSVDVFLDATDPGQVSVSDVHNLHPYPFASVKRTPVLRPR